MKTEALKMWEEMLHEKEKELEVLKNKMENKMLEIDYIKEMIFKNQ